MLVYTYENITKPITLYTSFKNKLQNRKKEKMLKTNNKCSSKICHENHNSDFPGLFHHVVIIINIITFITIILPISIYRVKRLGKNKGNI